MNEQVNHEITNCKDCGRWLKTPESRARAAQNGGRGPRCEQKYQRFLRVQARLNRVRQARYQPAAEENPPANAGTDSAVTSG